MDLMEYFLPGAIGSLIMALVLTLVLIRMAFSRFVNEQSRHIILYVTVGCFLSAAFCGAAHLIWQATMWFQVE